METPLTLTELEDQIHLLLEDKQPETALDLGNQYVGADLAESFRANLLLGVAGLLSQRLTAAQAYLESAVALEPEEIAPMINLAQVFFQQRDDLRARHWCERGFALDPNAEVLWQIWAALEISSDESTAAEQTLSKARALRSWMGHSLAAHLVDAQDHSLRAEYLSDVYEDGLYQNDDRFLLEYTAALGLAGKFEEIEKVVWKADKLFRDKNTSFSWQLYLHAAQAALSREDKETAKAWIDKALKVPGLSSKDREVILNVHQELEVKNEF